MHFRRVYKYCWCSHISISARLTASMKMMMMELVCFHFILLMLQRYKNYFKRKRNMHFFINSAFIWFHGGILYRFVSEEQ